MSESVLSLSFGSSRSLKVLIEYHGGDVNVSLPLPLLPPVFFLTVTQPASSYSRASGGGLWRLSFSTLCDELPMYCSLVQSHFMTNPL
jgi:hypothetical protein